jgi:hypothetical protein
LRDEEAEKRAVHTQLEKSIIAQIRKTKPKTAPRGNRTRDLSHNTRQLRDEEAEKRAVHTQLEKSQVNIVLLYFL